MSDAPFLMRLATAADRLAISELVTELDSADYLLAELDERLGSGGVYVAEHEGVLIGLFQLTLLGRGEAYFGGMRIGRHHQGKGYGTEFCHAQVELAHQLGCHSVLLLSEERNLTAHRTVERNGFHRLGPWRIWLREDKLARLAAAASGAARPVELGDAPAMLRFLAARPPEGVEGIVAAAGDPWVVHTLLPVDFSELVAAGQVVMVAGVSTLPEGVMVWARVSGNPETLLVRYLKGSRGAVAELLGWAGQQALASGCGQVVLSLPGPQGDAVAATGLCTGPTFPAYIFLHRISPDA